VVSQIVRGKSSPEAATLWNLAGRLRVRSGDEEQVLGPGDTGNWPADRAHAVAAKGGVARALLIVQDS